MTLGNLLTNKDRRFILVGGKGGVGKTSISASIAVKFASEGQKTLIISTDPAHSTSDSFNQDIGGGKIVKLEGIDNLYGLEISPDESGEDFKKLAGIEDEAQVDNIMSSLSSMGFEDVGELLETAPPGMDEAVALAKVIQIIQTDEYSDFERIVFDTAPTGHTLRLLSLPDFLDSFIGKLMKVRIKMNNATAAFKSLLGMSSQKDNSLEVMEALKKSMGIVRELFRDQIKTEFMIATIPTIMAINESERLRDQLKLEQIQVRHILINQIMPDNVDCKFCTVRSAGQKENLLYIDKVFHELNRIQIEFFDKEIRGIPALLDLGNRLFGN